MKSNRGDSSASQGIRLLEGRPSRVFAFGDIHGCNDELNAILKFLRVEKKASQADQFIFIGDYIDRGPQSKGVVETLINFKKEFPKTVFLRGNHEDMLLGFLNLGGSSGQLYLGNGGFEFFRSYGIEPVGSLSEIISSIPQHHLEFLTSLELAVGLGEFLFVHAGIHPSRSLEQQDPHDLMWIRAEFIKNEHNLGKTVVFGHTPFADVMLHLPFKIGIDTGLVFGNHLSVVELVSGDLFQVDKDSDRVNVSSLRALLNSRSD